jgi:hypothetical protein
MGTRQTPYVPNRVRSGSSLLAALLEVFLSSLVGTFAIKFYPTGIPQDGQNSFSAVS